MSTTPPPKLSVSLALEALQEVSEEIERVSAHLDNLRASRDDILIDAYGSVPVTKLARLSRLSRERVTKIASPNVRPKSD